MPAKHIHADPYRDLDRMLTYHAELDLALTYAMRRPNLARECATHAAVAAVHMGRPDLRAQANDVLVALNL